MSQVSTDNTEVYRIRVPNPATELTLGQDERGVLVLSCDPETAGPMPGWTGLGPAAEHPSVDERRRGV